MKKRNTFIVSALLMSAVTSSAIAGGHGVMVGGAEMLKTNNIIENASLSADHTTLVAAVKAADLVDTLQGEGPFTVLAPTNAAFDALPAGTVDSLLKPENRLCVFSVLSGPGKSLGHITDQSDCPQIPDRIH